MRIFCQVFSDIYRISFISIASRGQAAWHSKHLVQAEKSTSLARLKPSGQDFSQTLQGLQISGFFLTFKNGLNRLNWVKSAPSGHRLRHQDNPLAHSAPSKTPSQPIMGRKLPPVPAAIAPRQKAPTGQMTQKTGEWHSHAAPTTPPTSPRWIQARYFPDPKPARVPRLKIQRPGQIQLQKARPKRMINNKVSNAPSAKAGMNTPAAAITWAAPSGHEKFMGPRLTEQVEPIHRPLPIKPKKSTVTSDRTTCQALIPRECFFNRVWERIRIAKPVYPIKTALPYFLF